MVTWLKIDQIEEIARKASRRHPSMVMSFSDRFEAAYDGVVQAVSDGETELDKAATKAINKAVADYHHHYGIPRSTTSSKPHTGRQFHVYWSVRAEPWTFADDLIENMAVQQVMGQLSPCHQATLQAYAACGTIAGTAMAMGVQYKTASERIRVARNAARAAWFAPEAPAPLWHRSVGKAHDDSDAA